jgi:hypothetical protein
MKLLINYPTISKYIKTILETKLFGKFIIFLNLFFIDIEQVTVDTFPRELDNYK